MMNKLEYLSKDIKKKYLALINDEKHLGLIVEQIMNEYNDVSVLDILNEEKEIKLIVKADEDNIAICSNSSKYETYLFCPNWEHITIYSNALKKNYLPIGKQYYNNHYKVLKYHPSDINPHRYLYTCLSNNTEYEINLIKKDDDIDDLVIIKALLNKNIVQTRIKDLLELMNKVVDLGECELKIQNKYDQGSTIIVSQGVLTKYVEYLKNGNDSIKIYLENGKFYEDITESIEMNGDIIPFVKKKGEKHE